MSNKDVIQPATVNIDRKKKMPLDVKIVGWFIFVVSFIHFFFALLLLSGFGYFPPPSSGRIVLFGTILLVSEIPFGIYFLCLAIGGVVSAYGIRKGYKFGWWFMLIYVINNMLDGLPEFAHHPVGVAITICTGIALIIWLVWRRGLYGIGKTSYV